MESLEKYIRTYIRNEMSAYRTPGLVFAVTNRDRCVLTGAYGLSNLDKDEITDTRSKFPVGSITKTFTAVAVLRAVDRGLINLHTPVSHYIPWFRVNAPDHVITPHHLLSHQSGLPLGRDDLPPSPYMTASVWDFQPSYAPGAYFSTSNVGYQILGYLLEKAYGHPYSEVIREEVIIPLKMGDTDPVISNGLRCALTQGYRFLYDDRPSHSSHPLVTAPWFEYAAGDGSVVSTALDLCQFLRMLLNNGKAGSELILSEESYTAMTSRIAERSTDSWFGYGTYVRLMGGNTIIGHGGDMPGHQSMMLGDTNTGIGVVVLVNGPGYPWDIAEYILSVYRASYKGEPLPPCPSSAKVEITDNPEEYTGLYDGLRGRIEIEEADQRLYLKRDTDRLLLEPRGSDAFYTNHPDFDRFLWRFEQKDEEVTILHHGGNWFANERYTGSNEFVVPDEWKAYCGEYVMYSPWDSYFRVFIRRDRLILMFPGNICIDSFECVLHPRMDGEFVVVDGDLDMDCVSFECVKDGEAYIARLSGMPFYRHLSIRS